MPGPDGQLPQGDPLAPGTWPKWWKKYLNDWRPAKHAAANDGLEPPVPERPTWTDGPGADTSIVLDAARQRTAQFEDRITTAESRAARLTERALALLTLTFLATGYVAARLRDADPSIVVWVAALLPSAGSLVCLGLATIEALGVDRAGFVEPVRPSDAARFRTESAQRRALIAQEVRAAEMARWTGRKKLNEFLQARAWFTRGVTFVVLMGFAATAIWIWLGTSSDGQTDTSTSTTTTAPVVTTSTTPVVTTSTTAP